MPSTWMVIDALAVSLWQVYLPESDTSIGEKIRVSLVTPSILISPTVMRPPLWSSSPVGENHMRSDEVSFVAQVRVYGRPAIGTPLV